MRVPRTAGPFGSSRVALLRSALSNRCSSSCSTARKSTRGGGGGFGRGCDCSSASWKAHERATDAKLLAAENRLAARVDAAVADVLDAVRNAERRLTEEAPRLAEGAARTVWGKIGGERGTLPRGGVASGGDVRDVAERVSRCEANDDELRAQMRAVRELQQTHQRRLETLRDETSRLVRHAATEPRARGGDEEFAGFWTVPNAKRASETDAEEVGDALARSVEASARGFERLDAQRCTHRR